MNCFNVKGCKTSFYPAWVALGLCLAWLFSPLPVQAQAFVPGPTVNCDSPEDNLQKTIDKAPDGSRIFVRGSCDDGPYQVFDKSVQFVNFDWNKPARLSSVPGSEVVLHIRAATVRIEGLQFDASGANVGIFVENGALRLAQVTVEDASAMGIIVDGGRLSAENVRVTGCSDSGIHLAFSSSGRIGNSVLANNGFGVFVTENSGLNLWDTRIETSASNGVHVTASSSAFISRAEMISNGGAGVFVDRLSNVSLFESVIQGNTGPGVMSAGLYSVLSVRTPPNSIQNNNPDVLCGDRAILEVLAPQNSATKTSFVAPQLSLVQPGCFVSGTAIFGP